MAGGKRPIAGDPSTWPRFEFKSGLNGFKWDGMKLEGDPSNMPTNKLRYLINGRLVDGVIIDRAGFADFNAAPVDSADNCVIALNSTDLIVTRLFFSIIGCPGAFGGSLQFIDPESNPERQTYAQYPDAADFEPMLGRYGDEVYVAVKAKLYRSRQPVAEYGVTLATAAMGDTLIYDWGTTYRINFVQEFDGSLFIGLENILTPAASKIAKWDGRTITDDITGVNAPRAATLFREFLVVGFATAANHIRYRNQAGTWTTVAPAAGTVATRRSLDAMLSFKDALYLVDGAANVWRWTGPAGTLAIFRTVATATMLALSEHFESLYYLYNFPGSCRIGKYDGTTFTDVEKNLTTQFANDTLGGGMASFRNQLFVGMEGSIVLASPGINVSGTWLGTGSVSAPLGNTVTNLVVI